MIYFSITIFGIKENVHAFTFLGHQGSFWVLSMLFYRRFTYLIFGGFLQIYKGFNLVWKRHPTNCCKYQIHSCLTQYNLFLFDHIKCIVNRFVQFVQNSTKSA